MKQTDIIAQLKSLRDSQADMAKGNGDEALPEVRSGEDVMQVAAYNRNPDEKYIRYGGFYRGMKNPWCNSPHTHTTHWAYPPELPKEEE